MGSLRNPFEPVEDPKTTPAVWSYPSARVDGRSFVRSVQVNLEGFGCFEKCGGLRLKP